MRLIFNYYYLLFAYYCIAFILQCVFTNKGKRENIKYFSMFKSVFLGIMISSPICFIYVILAILTNSESDLNDVILSIFGLIAIFVLFFVQGIIGLYEEKNIKKNNLVYKNDIGKKLDIKAFCITIFSFIMILSLSIFVPGLNNSMINNSIETDAIRYLNNKYGDQGFTIIEVKKDYGYDGIVRKYLTGYDITVYSSFCDKYFIVRTEKDHKAFDDTFIYVYYYKSFVNSDENKKRNSNLLIRINLEINKLETYLNRYNKVSIGKLYPSDLDNRYIFDSNVIPNDYKKIPSIDEIYQLAEHYILNYKLELIIDKDMIDQLVKPDSADLFYDIKVKNTVINYYSEIANHIIEYDPKITSYKIKITYGGYIIIDSRRIYISTNGSDISTVEKIIKRK